MKKCFGHQEDIHRPFECEKNCDGLTRRKCYEKTVDKLDKDKERDTL